ncbi:MAG TPA: hypothetical protein VIE65_07210 [Methylobacter sp.]|jgi:hypothetical protein
MDVLTVFAQKESIFNDHVIVPVYWRTGLHRIKVLQMRLALTCQDRQSAAEAVAIRYLLGEANIFNANRTGINLKIVVSKGAIKKMARQVSQKHDLYEFGYPILTRYAEAELAVSKATDWFPGEDEILEAHLIEGEVYRGVEKMESDALGMVGITRHAMERYVQHCGTLDMNTSWKNISRRMKSRLDKIDLPPRVIMHKLRKYGEAPEVWKHPSNPLHYVFCQRHDCKLLVTVFNKDPDEQLEVFRPQVANRI